MQPILVLENAKVVVEEHRVVVIDKHGNQYVIEPDAYLGIFECQYPQYDCVLENLRLVVKELKSYLDEARAA